MLRSCPTGQWEDHRDLLHQKIGNPDEIVEVLVVSLRFHLEFLECLQRRRRRDETLGFFPQRHAIQIRQIRIQIEWNVLGHWDQEAMQKPSGAWF